MIYPNCCYIVCHSIGLLNQQDSLVVGDGSGYDYFVLFGDCDGGGCDDDCGGCFDCGYGEKTNEDANGGLCCRLPV